MIEIIKIERKYRKYITFIIIHTFTLAYFQSHRLYSAKNASSFRIRCCPTLSGAQGPPQIVIPPTPPHSSNVARTPRKSLVARRTFQKHSHDSADILVCVNHLHDGPLVTAAVFFDGLHFALNYVSSFLLIFAFMNRTTGVGTTGRAASSSCPVHERLISDFIMSLVLLRRGITRYIYRILY